MSLKLLKEILNMFKSESFNWWAMIQITAEQVIDFSNSLEINSKVTDFEEFIKYFLVFKCTNVVFRQMIFALAGKENQASSNNLGKLL